MSINNDKTLIYKYIDNNDYESIKKLSVFDDQALNYAISKKKSDIAKLLLSRNLSVNIVNENLMNSLMIAIISNENEIAKLILEHKNIDINYSGYYNKYNPLVLAVIHKQYDLVTILLDKDINVNQLDYNRNNIISNIILEKGIPSDLIIKILIKSNMRNININGNTPLHIMTIHNVWQQYNIILQELDLDPKILNNDNKIAIDYVPNENKQLFTNMLAANLLRNNKCFEMQMCKKLAQKHPNLKKTKSVTDFGTFSPTVINSTMYTTFLLVKYSILGVPYQIFDKKLYDNDLKMIKDNDSVLNNYIKIYTKRMFHIAPYEIIFSLEGYFIHPRIKMGIDKCMQSKSIRYIFLKLSIVEPEGNHATVLIYDKHKNILEYFEPYGKINHPIEHEINKFINTEICKLFKTQSDKCFKFYSKIGLQASSDDTQESQNIGDPVGYCLAWCYYYIEERINNPDKTIDEIIDNTINNVINKALKPTHNCLLDFIRQYTKWFHDKKIQFYKKANIPKEFIFVKHLPKPELRKLINAMYNTFMIITRKHFV